LPIGKRDQGLMIAKRFGGTIQACVTARIDIRRVLATEIGRFDGIDREARNKVADAPALLLDIRFTAQKDTQRANGA
jgi:hypothetical protein